MPRPPRPHTDLKKRLDLSETRAKTIRELVRVREKTGSIGRTAEHFGVNLRTLMRFLANYPDLREAFDNLAKSATGSLNTTTGRSYQRIMENRRRTIDKALSRTESV